MTRLAMILVMVLALGGARAQEPAGLAFGWGSSASGQADPPAVPYVQVTAGGYHSCGLTPDGQVACWGCGDDAYDWGACDPRPYALCTPDTCDDTVLGVRRTSSRPVVDLEAGSAHVCAVTADGSAECWGCRPDMYHGQCTVPEGLMVLRQVRDRAGQGTLSAGETLTCAVQTDGAVSCWGCADCETDFGQCTPPEGLRARLVSAGGEHACAIGADGTVICWGNDERGQASPPPGIKGVSVAAGQAHSCAVTADGRVECWGCGGGFDRGQCAPPRDLRASAVAAGVFSSCAITALGEIRCWGCKAPEAGEYDAMDPNIADRSACQVPDRLPPAERFALGHSEAAP